MPLSDNVVANAGSGGATFRTLSDGALEWPASVVAYVTGGSAGAWTLQPVDATHGLPVSVVGTVPVSGSVTIGAGSAVIGHVIVDSGTITTVSTVTTVSAVTAITNALPAGTNTLGGTVPTAATTGGATPYRYLSSGAANQDSANPKGSAGQVYSISAFNTNAAARYLKLYNKATGPTSGDTPVQTYLIPGNANGAGLTLSFPVGMAFGTGIGLRITTGMADNDTGAAATGDVAVSLTYL